MARNRKMDEKLLALRKLEQNLGNVSKTSRETGIATKTLRQWRDKYGIRLGTALQIERLRERLITESFDLASHIAEAMHDAPLNHRAAALNQMIDKVLLLTELLDEEDTDEQTSQTQTIQIEYVDAEGKTYEAHLGQRTILNSIARFRVVACGRRWGKTELGKNALVENALRKHRCWWVSPTYEISEQVWRDLKRILRNFTNISVSEINRRIDFDSGGMIAVRSANKPDNLRGEGLDFVVLDEAAFMSSEIWAEIIQPMLLTTKGSALFLSSPNGLNWFWEVYRLGLNGTKDSKRSWRSFHFTSYDNPLIDAEEIDAIRLNTPERTFREEYLAEFIADGGTVFRGVREIAIAPVTVRPIEGKRYVAGLDWARDNDYTCMIVVDAETRQMVALDRFHGIGWELQRERVKSLYERWQPSAIWAEANNIGSPNIEALQNEGLPVRSFTTSAQSKAPLIDALALAIERRELTLLPDEVLLGELIAYRMERLPGGGYRFSAPNGGHDDTVIALALAWHGILHGTMLIDFV